MENNEKKLYGFGVNDTRLFSETFESVEELIEFAQKKYDEQNDEYFHNDQYRILVSYIEYILPKEFAPSLKEIAEDMTERLYSEHNLDDDAEVYYYPEEEAEKAWEAFVEKYFSLPYSFIGYADVGWYNLKERKWEKKED